MPTAMAGWVAVVAFQAGDVNAGQRLGLHFHVDLRIDMGRIQRHMAKPGAYGVDVDTGAQKINGRCVPNGMGAYALRGQRRHRLARQIGILRHDAMYSETRQRLVHPVPEDSVGLVPIAHKPG
jgi:hypothetical protein